MAIIFNEKLYAEKLLKQGFINQKRMFIDVLILAKYLFYIGKTKQQVKSDIIDFCKKHIEYFCYENHIEYIKEILSKASKSPLKFNTVLITQKEFDTIKNINNPSIEKIAFVLLVIYKYYDCNSFRVNISELFNLAEVKLTNSHKQMAILQFLTKNNSKAKRSGLYFFKRRVVFSDTTNTGLIEIENFDNLIYAYLKLKGDRVTKCIVCNTFVLYGASKFKYCRDCYKLHRREVISIKVSQYRKNVNNPEQLETQ